ncbi:putative GTP pyrophosphokinase [Bradyrhizobium sp. USDA 4449]
MNLADAYSARYHVALAPVAKALEAHLGDLLGSEPRVDRISARAKSIDRFLAKAEAVVEGKIKYADPLLEIQDQLGARIVTFYRPDVDRVAEHVLKYFRAIESKDLVPDSEWEFGYFGRHFVLVVPSDVIDGSIDKSQVPRFFELQIKTLFQHAWSEANHDLGYKPGLTPLNSDEKRRLAFTSAQAWGADRVFDELFRERQQRDEAPH